MLEIRRVFRNAILHVENLFKQFPSPQPWKHREKGQTKELSFAPHSGNSGRKIRHPFIRKCCSSENDSQVFLARQRVTNQPCLRFVLTAMLQELEIICYRQWPF